LRLASQTDKQQSRCPRSQAREPRAALLRANHDAPGSATNSRTSCIRLERFRISLRTTAALFISCVQRGRTGRAWQRIWCC
jgi:hypothetical protein